MSPEQTSLVQQTWQQVIPIADTATDLFYRRLFEIDPGVRRLFHRTDMDAQRRVLVRAITGAVEGLDDLETLAPVVEDLGRRHAAYGVTDAHYDSVGAALLWTLEQGLGPSWTPKVAAAWTAAFKLLFGAMRSGGYSAPACAASG